ncbi:MAG: hypothetical protein KGD65_00875 [Candidatus Lokiarchaeota archaeon]|nr:hypothetical protein [Candidatus Lokiarchaeota archaeon]
MEHIQKMEEKVEGITDIQRAQIYEYAKRVSKETLEEVCPALLRIAMDSEKGALKNQLGNVIFHLQKNERIETVIGLQKLIDAALIVNPEEMFKIFEESDEEAQELAKKIKGVL